MSTSPLRTNLAQQGFESIAFTDSPSNRRQRITMACHYCRHRKIRCCGGAPCRNCTRANRECDYAPVPEEVNRATREKKAAARQTKMLPTLSTPLGAGGVGLGLGFGFDMGMGLGAYSATSSPVSMYTPYMHNTPTFDVPFIASPVAPSHSHSHSHLAPRPALSHRRTASTPAGASAPWAQPPPAPLLHSPAMLESSGWMYNAYTSPSLLSPGYPTHTPLSSAPVTPLRALPSVLEQTPAHDEYLAASQASSGISGPAQHSNGLAPALAISTPTSNTFPQMPTMPAPPVAPSTPMLSRTQSYHAGTTQTFTPAQQASASTPYLRVPPPPLNFARLGLATPGLDGSASMPGSAHGHYTPQMYHTPSSTAATSVSPPLTPATPYPPTYRAPGVASYYAQANGTGHAQGVSPTLAPALELDEGKGAMGGQGYAAPLVGLGIAMPQTEDVFYSPVNGQQGYFGAY